MTIKNYKDIFFHGYIVIFGVLLVLSALFDTYIANYTDAIIEFITLLFLILLYYFWKRSKHKNIFAVILAWLSAIFGYLIVIMYDFSMDTQYFLLFVPFAFFYLLDKRMLRIHLTLYFIFTISLILWGYMHSTNRLFFDNPTNLTVWAALFIFVLSIGIFNYLALSHSFQHLEDSNKQKDILLQEVHHRVKNNLNMMSSMIGLQETHNDIKMQTFVNDYRQRINAIALIHELLYKNQNYEKIDFLDYTKKLGQYLISSCANPEARLNIEANNLSFSLQTMTDLGLILQELISNSLKYADIGEQYIYIELTSDNDSYTLKYKDNGAKYSTKVTSDDSLGLTLVRLKVQELNGSIDIEKEALNSVSLKPEKKIHISELYYIYKYTIKFPHEKS